jgi:opine dehydrogenase
MRPVASPLWTALFNPDIVLVAVPALLGAYAPPADRNLARLLSGPAASVIERVEDERADIAAALGYDVPSTAAWLAEATGQRPAPLGALLGGLGDWSVPAHDDLSGLADVVPFGLVPLSEIGRAAGVPTPCIDGLVEVASAMLRNDYRLGGRTGSLMGIENVVADLRNAA